MTPPSLIQRLASPPPAHHEELIDFLHSLGGPVAFRISGRVPGRTRALLTLMHGNEPSGLWAIWQMLRSGFTPEFDLLCVILSHEAACTEPPFTHRTIPGKRDLNRCFYPPFTGYNGKLAAELLELLDIPNLEAIVDMHNTSGEGPSYCVSTQMTPVLREMALLFSTHIIHTDLRLGTVMEGMEDKAPIITVEAGGARNPKSHQLALEGIRRFASLPSFEPESPDQRPLTVFTNPIRVELKDGVDLSFGEENDPNSDVTMRSDVDRHNFGIVPSGETLGWINEKGIEHFSILDTSGECHARKFFKEEEGKLITLRPLHLFMLTTNVEIAKADCLFYVLPDEEECVLKI